VTKGDEREFTLDLRNCLGFCDPLPLPHSGNWGEPVCLSVGGKGAVVKSNWIKMEGCKEDEALE